MKFQVGDKVLVKHSNEAGEVIDIINDKMVMVEVKGVRFPAYSDQIDFPYFKQFSEKKIVPEPSKRKIYVDEIKPEKLGKQERSTSKYQVDNGVWLSFFPVFDKDVFDDDVVEFFKIYLVNQTEMSLDFTYHLRFAGGESAFELKNAILPFNDFYLHNVPLEELNDGPKFDFEFSLSIPQKGMVTHLEASHKIKPKQLFQRIEQLRQNQEANFSYLLFNRYPVAPPEEKMDLSSLHAAGYKVYDASKVRQHLEPARSVVDLHVEKLSDKPGSLTPGEIMDLQMRTFEKFYELSVLHQQAELTIIHGVGTGRLRDEIHQILRTRKEVKSYVNRHNPRYGYGATEIYFQY